MHYWSKVLEGRVNRRRALAASGAAAASAAILAACGSSGEEKTKNRDKSGFLSQPADTTSKAVKGGVLEVSRGDDPTTLDVIANNQSTSWAEMLQVYSHLTKAGIRSDKPEAFEADAAQSWELGPDSLQVTFKLRPNMKFDSRPPTSGRSMTSEDVKWSFERFRTLSPYRSEVFQSLSPAAPVESIQTPDAQTVVVKLAFPYASIIEMIGFEYYLYVMPTEAEAKFNAKGEMRGSGPFRLATYTPSLSLEYAKNPDWYVKDRPFLDGIRRTVIPDYAAGLAQFENKTLWTYAVRQEDVLRVKRSHPEMVMLQDRDIGIPSLASTPSINISKRPDSPMRDVRLRRAASMLIDRDSYIATFSNADAFTSQGLPVDTLWNAHLPTGAPSWIDPRDSSIGEGGKYFQFNPTEARKLIEAAGAKGTKLPYHWYLRTGAALHVKMNEVLTNMMQDGSAFNLDIQPLDYNNEWREVCQRSAGEAYTGFCFNNSGGFNEDAYMVAKYTPGGKYSASYLPIPGITDAVLAARKEPDAKKRGELIKDLQRKLALEMPDIPFPGRTYEFTLRWPWLKNHGVFVTGGDSALEFVDYWYDASAKT